MTDITISAELVAAVRLAVGAALEAGVAPDLAAIYDDVPQGAKPPFVKIGSLDADPEDDKDEDLYVLTVELIHVYQGRDRGVLLAMMAASERAMRAGALAARGANLGRPRFLRSSASDASPVDGVTYAGVSNFSIFAEPA